MTRPFSAAHRRRIIGAGIGDDGDAGALEIGDASLRAAARSRTKRLVETIEREAGFDVAAVEQAMQRREFAKREMRRAERHHVERAIAAGREIVARARRDRSSVTS